jgi:glycosyltransferase involved in cell wall biosynthesis
MRVLVTVIAQPTGISGVQRHAFNLVRCLLQRAEITSVHLALAPWQLHLPALAGLEPDDRLHIEAATVKRNSISRNLWHLRDLPKLARTVEAGLVHLGYPVPFRRAAMPCPVVMTLHDLYPFEIAGNFGFPQVILNRWILRLALSQADAISCVSRTTLRHLQSFGYREKTSSFIPNCVQPGPASSACGPLPGWNGELFLLAVAQHRRNKNLDLLLCSFSRLLASGLVPRAARLVIVGMPGPETPKLRALAQQLGLTSRIDFLEGLSEAELQWCYGHCAAVVSPSSIEGFGLPVVEGRLAGCRVVCSDIPAFRELTGPQVHLFDLQGEAERNLCTVIADVLAKPRPMPEFLPEFAMNAVADGHLDLYRTTLARHAQNVQPSPSNSPLNERQTL